MNHEIKHFRVTGIVQGVYFRAATQKQAQALNLRGWVCNCADGSVELVAAGGEAELEQLAQWLHRGPPAARVDEVLELPVAQSDSQALDWPFVIRR